MRLIDADALERAISVSHSMTDDCGIKTGYEISMKLVEDAPTIEPMQWIPCSERMPTEYGEYLVTREAHGWNCKRYIILDMAEYDDDEWHKAEKVLAWMPLPEPYGGDADGRP